MLIATIDPFYNLSMSVCFVLHISDIYKIK